MEKKTITITVKRVKGVLHVSNNRGQEWSFTSMDETTAIASLVFFTLYKKEAFLSLFANNYSIKLTMETNIK